jgi:hypothetical protein
MLKIPAPGLDLLMRERSVQIHTPESRGVRVRACSDTVNAYRATFDT